MMLPAVWCPQKTEARHVDRRSSGLAVAVIAVLLALTGSFALTADDAGVTREARELQAAIATMTTVVNEAPDAVQAQAEAEVRVLAQSLARALARIENQPAPIVDGELVQDLTYLADVVGAINDELLAARQEQAEGGSTSALAARVRALVRATDARIEAVEAAIDRWTETTATSVVEMSARPDAVVISSTDRLLYDFVRYSAVALFLVALLVLGLRLLALGETGIGLAELFRQAPVMATTGTIAVAAFMVATLVIMINPGAIAGPTRVLVQPRAHPCGALAAQRQNLWDAQKLGNPHLIKAVKARLRPAGQACLELESEFAAIEAVERFIAEPAPATTRAVAEHSAPAAKATTARRTTEIDRLITALQTLVAQTPRAADAAEAQTAEVEAAAQPASPIEATASADEVAVAAPADEVNNQAATADEVSEAGPATSVPLPPGPAPRDLVTTADVNFRDGPSLDAQRIGTLPAGTAVLLLREEDGWSAVQLEDGRAVYVASDYLRSARP